MRFPDLAVRLVAAARRTPGAIAEPTQAATLDRAATAAEANHENFLCGSLALLGKRVIKFTIFGEPASAKNSRKPANVGKSGEKRTIWIKSDKARNYEYDALRQIPPAARVQIQGPVRVTLRIWYASERPDLDESLILDILQNRFKGKAAARQLVQKGVYCNDRQVKEKHVYWGKDPLAPRTEVVVEEIEMPQAELFLRPPPEAKQRAQLDYGAEPF